MDLKLLVPCIVQDLCPEVALAAAGLLNMAGLPPKFPKAHTCCGQPLYKQGRFRRAREAARHCMEVFAGAGAIVAPSASCVAMLRNYPLLFGDDPRLLQQARETAARAFELCQFLDSHVPGLQFRPFAAKMVLHDACQARLLGVSNAARRLLGRVPGLELLEPEPPAACCGFGGSFSIEYPEISQAILEDKLDVLEELGAGADAVVTTEPGCMLNLRAGLEARGSRLKALHVAQVLAEAAGVKDHA